MVDSPLRHRNVNQFGWRVIGSGSSSLVVGPEVLDHSEHPMNPPVVSRNVQSYSAHHLPFFSDDDRATFNFK
jgi:hypothetical protein